MAWHIVEKFIEQTAQQSTVVGKVWTTIFVLRFLIVVTIADNAFEGEQEGFSCGTLTPSCKNVCFNKFSPLSLVRLWAFQVLFVAFPSVIFIIYAAHITTEIGLAKELKEKEEARSGKDSPDYIYLHMVNGHVTSIDIGDNADKPTKENSEREDKKKDYKNKNDIVPTILDADAPPRLLMAYLAQVILRMIVEILFIGIQLSTNVYKFHVPELYQCEIFPCPNVVNCFVSRPKEKTVMIWVMLGTASIMIGLDVIDLIHVGYKKIKGAWKRRGDDVTNKYKGASTKMSDFGRRHAGYKRDEGGYPQPVRIRVAYIRCGIPAYGGGVDEDGFM